MREPTFWILTALAGGAQHGYALLESVETLSAGAVHLKVPTLYAALDRLMKEGLITLDHEEIFDGRARRYFTLSDDGAAALRREVERMERSAARAKRQLKTITVARLV